MKQSAKRVDIITIKQVKENSILYPERKISSPVDAHYLFKTFIGDLDREAFIVAYLNVKNEVNAIHTVSLGTLSASLVHPREVFKAALTSNASGIILCHNHPSGSVAPSKEDQVLTERLVSAGEILGISVIDHVIITNDEVFSFKETGIIK